MKTAGASNWSESEIAVLKEYFPVEGLKVCNRLPDRTAKAVEFKAYSLKLKAASRARAPVWSSEELATLREFYPIEGGAVAQRFPSRSAGSISTKAHELGLRVDRSRRRAQEPSAPQPSSKPSKPPVVVTSGSDKYASLMKPQKPPTVAEQLSGLPWFKYPTTASSALRIARVCGEGLRLGDQNAMPDDEKAWWASVKCHMEALAARLSKLAKVA